MAHPHGLVNQTFKVDAVALGTLASRIAIAINAEMTAPESTFLMKRVRYFLQLVGRTLADDGPVLVVCNHGNASLAEVAAAIMEQNAIGPSDASQMLGADNAWMVYQNTIVPFVTRGDGTEAHTDGKWIKFGANGIPATENGGLAFHAFNAGSGALSTGSSINGIIQIQGVWLND